MKLIDCFMYFDEDLVLDIRLNTLKEKVDKFIIVEATKNHAGKDKKLNFKIENFSKFKDKIHYLVVDDLPVDVGKFKKTKKTQKIRHGGRIFVNFDTKSRFSNLNFANIDVFQIFTKMYFFDFSD